MRASIVTLRPSGERREVTPLDVPAPAEVLGRPCNLPRIVNVRAWLHPIGAASPDLAEVSIPGGGLTHVRAELLRLLGPEDGAEIILFPRRPR